mgnify:CR=1 FL=1
MRALLAAVVAAIALAGCGSSDTDQVHTTLDTFVRAVATRDAKPICDQVLAPALIARLKGVGLSCQTAITRFFFSCKVRNPTLQVGRVSIKGSTASALVLSAAASQTPGIYQLGLVKTSQGWRVASETAENRSGGGSC